MESQREDCVILALRRPDGQVLRQQSRFRSRIAHHIDFPDYSDDELLAISN